MPYLCLICALEQPVRGGFAVQVTRDEVVEIMLLECTLLPASARQSHPKIGLKIPWGAIPVEVRVLSRALSHTHLRTAPVGGRRTSRAAPGSGGRNTVRADSPKRGPARYSGYPQELPTVRHCSIPSNTLLPPL